MINISNDGDPGMQRLWLVRHGATQWNDEQRFCGHSDIPLSEKGQEQALWLAQRLRTEPIQTIYCSDLLRARQTADSIAAQCARPISINVSHAWREIAFGEWEGLTYGQIVESSKSPPPFFTAPLQHAAPGGESLTDLVHRVESAYRDLIHTCQRETATDGGGDVVLVSHGGPLRALLCLLLAMPLERQWQLQLAPGSLSALDISLCSVNDALPIAILALFNVQRVPGTHE